jgi:hypothetical protein
VHVLKFRSILAFHHFALLPLTRNPAESQATVVDENSIRRKVDSTAPVCASKPSKS